MSLYAPNSVSNFQDYSPEQLKKEHRIRTGQVVGQFLYNATIGGSIDSQFGAKTSQALFKSIQKRNEESKIKNSYYDWNLQQGAKAGTFTHDTAATVTNFITGIKSGGGPQKGIEGVGSLVDQVGKKDMNYLDWSNNTKRVAWDWQGMMSSGGFGSKAQGFMGGGGQGGGAMKGMSGSGGGNGIGDIVQGIGSLAQKGGNSQTPAAGSPTPEGAANIVSQDAALDRTAATAPNFGLRQSSGTPKAPKLNNVAPVEAGINVEDYQKSSDMNNKKSGFGIFAGYPSLTLKHGGSIPGTGQSNDVDHSGYTHGVGGPKDDATPAKLDGGHVIPAEYVDRFFASPYAKMLGLEKNKPAVQHQPGGKQVQISPGEYYISEEKAQQAAAMGIDLNQFSPNAHSETQFANGSYRKGGLYQKTSGLAIPSSQLTEEEKAKVAAYEAAHGQARARAGMPEAGANDPYSNYKKWNYGLMGMNLAKNAGMLAWNLSRKPAQLPTRQIFQPELQRTSLDTREIDNNIAMGQNAAFDYGRNLGVNSTALAASIFANKADAEIKKGQAVANYNREVDAANIGVKNQYGQNVNDAMYQQQIAQIESNAQFADKKMAAVSDNLNNMTDAVGDTFNSNFQADMYKAGLNTSTATNHAIDISNRYDLAGAGLSTSQVHQWTIEYGPEAAEEMVKQKAKPTGISMATPGIGTVKPVTRPGMKIVSTGMIKH